MAQNIEAKQLDITQLENWKGLAVYDGEKKKLGKLKDVYLDDATKKPKWGLVALGMTGSKELFVPLEVAVQW